MEKHQRIVVLDYGSQYTQLLARRVRELGFYSEIITPDDFECDESVKGIILSGGPNSVYDPSSPNISDEVLNSGIPILGVCYGMQLLAHRLGGKVEEGELGEYGGVEVEIIDHSGLFKGIPKKIRTWMSHGDSVRNVPESFKITSKSLNNVIAAMENPKKKIYAVQFHPEVVQTQYGIEIIKNFLELTGMKPNWDLEDYVREKIEEIKAVVGNSKAICAVSGGVDSTVAAVIVNKALGNNLVPVFVNHGLLRLNEEHEVPFALKKLGLNVITVDASKEFLTRLKGVEDPEKKRKIIGETFIRVFEREARKIERLEYLVQGTIYSDVIESGSTGSKNVAKIKSHHNVGGLPEKMDLKIIEPLRELFKDEVRKIGKILNIPDEFLERHPFPGPGLAIRIIGEVNKENLELLKRVDKIFIDLLKEKDLYHKVWQAFTVLLPIKSVGVVGDKRAYENVVALRAVQSSEGMTAEWSNLPYEFLDEVAKKIVGSIKGIGRVVYDITSKPPATIEWE
ncbi:MAG: hypothetical protein PWQ48_840 [Thermotogaceae bacterium]|jgi:GMP synthase (glutamine-hydrolysing)|nr:hypothetical protein [Thermotogaceae bacterium]